ncbi:hypothetical protein MUP77_21740 [Candidatus Bathyarchaeota archaeon]|nr:hypothetical protein [Candidatus Bathyarchaeota archaeon]
MKTPEIERTIRELKTLCGRKPLLGNDSLRVNELLGELKEAGYSNLEVSELLDKTLSVSTIKTRTTGIHTTDPSSKTDTIKVLSQLMQMDLTLDDVRSTVTLRSDLDSKEVSPEEVSNLISDVNQAKLSLKELIQLNQERSSSGLTFEQLKETLDFQSQMKQENLTIEGLRKILQASKSFGGYIMVLDAISSYGSLKTLNSEVEHSTSDKSALEQRIQGLRKDVDDLEARKTSVDSELKLFDRLRSLGFDEATLKELGKCSAKYGGPAQVLAALNSYTGNAQIKEECVTLDKERVAFESKRMKAESDYVHLKAAIDMCEILLHKKRFSVQSIMDIYSLAERFGEATAVIKAIEEYGEIAAMKSHLEELTLKQSELEIRMKKREELVNDLTSKATEMNQRIKTSLAPLSANVSKAIENVRKAGEQGAEKVAAYAEGKMSALADTYEAYSEELGKLKAVEGRLADEVEMGRIIWAALMDPTAAASFPFDWVKKLVISALSFCERKGYNPIVTIPFDLANRDNMLYIGSKAGVADLLRWASIGFSPKTS